MSLFIFTSTPPNTARHGWAAPWLQTENILTFIACQCVLQKRQDDIRLCRQTTAKSYAYFINAHAAAKRVDVVRNCTHVLHTCSNGCEFHRRMIYNLMRDMARKNIMVYSKLEITGKRSTREKILAYLAHMEQQTGKTAFDIPFDRQELADYLEVDRSGLSAELSKLKREGVIDCRKNQFVLL